MPVRPLVRVLLALAAVISLQGCWLGNWPMTYLSPHPVGSGSPVQVFTNCYSGARFFTQTRASVGVGAARVCFTSPRREVGDPRQDPVGSRALCAGFDWQAGTLREHRLIFDVVVEGEQLGADSVVASLETRGRTVTAIPWVRASPAVTNARFSLPPKLQLMFVFDEGCDPTAEYRLTVRGVSGGGHGLDIPPVDFRPTTEYVPVGAD